MEPDIEEIGHRMLKEEESSFASFDNSADLVNLFVAMGCVACAAMAAGLTMGLVSLDTLQMEIKSRSGTPEEKKNAAKVIPLIKRHHLLIVTLMLFNSLANEALPIFLDALVPSYVAIVISVTMILIFGEVLPSALFTGPRQLEIAGYFSNVTWLLIGLFYPVSYPISLFLDWLLGHEENTIYSRDELSVLLDIQHQASKQQLSAINDGMAHAPERRPSQDDGLSGDEFAIVKGVLSMARKKIINVMIPISEAFCLASSAKLNDDTMAQILGSGFSRIPVYEGTDKRNIRGILLAKKLIVVNPSDARPLKTLPLKTPLCVHADISLLDLLNQFQEGNSHLALVSYDPKLTRERLQKGLDLVYSNATPIGIITLEDIIEEMLQEEILDEDDRAQQRRAIQKIKNARQRKGASFFSRLGRRSSPASSPNESALLAAANAGHLGSVNATPDDEHKDIRPELVQMSNKGILPTLVRKYSRNATSNTAEDDQYVPPTFALSDGTSTSRQRQNRRSAKIDEDDPEVGLLN